MIPLLIYILSSLGTTMASSPVSKSTITTSTVAVQETRKSSVLLLGLIQKAYRYGLILVVQLHKNQFWLVFRCIFIIIINNIIYSFQFLTSSPLSLSNRIESIKNIFLVKSS